MPSLGGDHYWVSASVANKIRNLIPKILAPSPDRQFVRDELDNAAQAWYELDDVDATLAFDTIRKACFPSSQLAGAVTFYCGGSFVDRWFDLLLDKSMQVELAWNDLKQELATRSGV